MAQYGVSGARAIQRLTRRFPNLPQAASKSILETAKASRLAARKIMAGELQASEQAAVLPINPGLRRKYRYQAIAEVQKPGTGDTVSVNVYIHSSRPLGRLALTNQLESVAASYSTKYFRGAPLIGITVIAGERQS